MNPLALLALAGVAVAIVALQRSDATTGEKPKQDKGKAPRMPPAAPSVPALLRAALEALPSESSILEPPSSLWDAILGGRVADAFGRRAWRYYAEVVGKNPDGTDRKGGTTCGIFAAYCAAKAGWPATMINRASDDRWAPGSGFRAGDHISKMLDAAKKMGWFIEAKRGGRAQPAAPSSAPIAGTDGWDDDLGAEPFTLRPGDYYWQFRENATYDGKPVDGSHVGIVKSVGEVERDGSRVVVTIDGGDTCSDHQCARWHTRKLTADGFMVYRGASSRLMGVVRAPS